MFEMMSPRGYGKKIKRRGRRTPQYGGLFSQHYLNDMMGLGFQADVIEKREKYIIEAELPGVARDDIEIELEDHLLTISATKKTHCDAEEEDYLCQERTLGTFQRSFKLKNVKEDQIKASYENGMLLINLPKREADSPDQRKIEIE